MPKDHNDGGKGDFLEGVVLRAQSGYCTVLCDDREVECRVRGRLKKGPQRSRTVAVAGDCVRLSISDDGGVVEEVLPRRNKVSRMSSKRDRGRIEQVVMANLDQVIVVQSVRRPDPIAGFVDRLLTTAARYEVDGILCVNKTDLDPDAAADSHWDYYGRIGCRILRTSAETGEGVEAFHRLLQGCTSLLLGASGTGKSSLLARATGMELRVGDVTDKTGLGRHTTTRTDLFPLAGGGFIADSPGIRGFDPWDLEPRELHEVFLDFHDPAQSCRFTTCLHRDEPVCGVKEAVAAGVIPRWRYNAYLGMLKDLEATQDAQRKRR